ncbi:vitamin K epoxide reductase family protein [Kitasatospora viridis]|uniref:Putative membrane protein n=1 Tax=Kitasatospora viridis TaxID=281105 RepID=A0A561TV99_9ACTN|nr:vitamin K epoxide reductase family protein [Kitasatospora viridis]TWF91029.1 putative membrane protein [Kitasatospora viridis]
MTTATTAAAEAPPRTGKLTDTVTAARSYALLLLIAGAVGLAASITLTLEKIRLLEDPSYVPSCNINPIISCGSVMRTSQASAFGFPNSLIGVAGFAVVVTVGVVALTGARLPRWFWLGLQAGTLFGVCFITWLMDQTLYHIGAVCPYCIVVWTATIPLFWYTLLHNLRHQVIPTPAPWRPAIDGAAGYHWVVPALWYLTIVMLILNRFWYYWHTLL